jgi:hypothetical protein
MEGGVNMADFPDGSVLIEAISGKWYRFAKGGRAGTILLDLPNKILLGINVSSKMIEIFIPSDDDIYHRAGDITFHFDNGKANIQLFSESLEEIQLDNNSSTISNTFSDITSLCATLDLEKAKQWWSKRLPKE